MHKYLPNLYIFLDQYDKQIFENNITNVGVVYRNYNNHNKEKELIKIKKACRKKRYPLFVSNDVKLALKLKADGIYIPSFNKLSNFKNLEKKNFVILGSAHNQKEIKEKILQKCKAVFLSPIFYVEKSTNFLGVNKFNSLSLSFTNKTNILALGGISKNNIGKLRLLRIKGFGGIRMFKKKPAFKRPVFLKNNFFI